MITNQTKYGWYIFAKAGLAGKYKLRSDKPSPSRRHFGRAVDRSIVKVEVEPT